MKKMLCLIALIVIVQSAAFSQTVYDDNYAENPNYAKGLEYYNNSQYSSAINEFKKALRADPKDESALIGLSNAYNMRAQYYSNKSGEINKAITDIKSAIFFNKYYRRSLDGNSTAALAQMEKNLKILEKTGLTPAETAKYAKKLRTQGEFAAAGFDYFRLVNNPEYKAEANSALGDIFKIFNRPDKAIIFYQNSLSQEPENAETHLKLARVYEDMNDFAAALKEYSYALNSSNESEDILSSLERIWRKKSDAAPEDAEAHANLGVIYQKQKRYNEAMSEYRRAENLNPNNLNTKINIGILYQEQQKYNDALGVYNTLIQMQPQNANLHLYKAQCLKALNKKEEAAAAYKTVLQLSPNNKQAGAEMFEMMRGSMGAEELLAYLYQNVKDNPADAGAYYEFAYELHKAGKIDDAISYYNQTIKLDNKNIDAYINLSQCFRQKKNYPEADRILKQASAVSPDNKLVKEQLAAIKNEFSGIMYNTAANYYENGSYEAAIEAYSQIRPETAEANIGIAASYHAMGNTIKAIEYYNKAMELDADNADIPYYIAAIYANSNDMINADKYTRMALAKNPMHSSAKELSVYIASKHTESLLEEAVKLYEDEKYSAAIAKFDEIIKINPNEASVFYYKALSNDALKNYEAAIADYRTAVKLSPEMNIAYYSIAAAYDNLGKYKQAKEFYKKYVNSIQDDNEYKKYALSRLKVLEP